MKTLIILLFISAISFKALAQSTDPCKLIEFNNDDVRGFKSYNTPIDVNSPHLFYINKIIESGKKPQYYLHIRINEPLGKVVNGVFILLKNGKRIARPEQEVELEIDNEDHDLIHLGYKQSAVIQLTPSDIMLLKASPIVKYAISYLKESLYNADDIYQMFLCLLNK